MCRTGELPAGGLAPPRLPRGDLAEVVHRLRALDARDEAQTAAWVDARKFADDIRHAVEVLRGVHFGEDEGADDGGA